MYLKTFFIFYSFIICLTLEIMFDPLSFSTQNANALRYNSSPLNYPSARTYNSAPNNVYAALHEKEESIGAFNHLSGYQNVINSMGRQFHDYTQYPNAISTKQSSQRDNSFMKSRRSNNYDEYVPTSSINDLFTNNYHPGKNNIGNTLGNINHPTFDSYGAMPSSTMHSEYNLEERSIPDKSIQYHKNDSSQEQTIQKKNDAKENDIYSIQHSFISDKDEAILAPIPFEHIRLPTRILIAGATNSGKTFFTMHLLSKIKHRFDFVYGFFGSYGAMNTFKHFIPRAYCFVLEDVDRRPELFRKHFFNGGGPDKITILDVISRVIDIWTENVEPYFEKNSTDKPPFNILFILDDIHASYEKQADREKMNPIFKKGRHVGISIINIAQKIKDFTTVMRSNASIFAWRPTGSIEEIDSYRESIGTVGKKDLVNVCNFLSKQEFAILVAFKEGLPVRSEHLTNPLAGFLYYGLAPPDTYKNISKGGNAMERIMSAMFTSAPDFKANKIKWGIVANKGKEKEIEDKKSDKKKILSSVRERPGSMVTGALL